MELPEALLPLLPALAREEIFTYRKQDDRIRLLAGKLLLRSFMADTGHGLHLLDAYTTDANGRPLVPGFFDFSITHSGHIVACAIFPGQTVGIDVEKMRPIVPANFHKQFSPPEMMQIMGAPSSREKFFEFWTQKEAVMKADGRGMRIPLHAIRLRGDHATIDDRDGRWELIPLSLHEDYKSHACVRVLPAQTVIEELDVFGQTRG